MVVDRVYGPKGPVLGKKKAKKSQAASSVNMVLDMQCLHVLSKRAMPASGGSLPSVAVMLPCPMLSSQSISWPLKRAPLKPVTVQLASRRSYELSMRQQPAVHLSRSCGN